MVDLTLAMPQTATAVIGIGVGSELNAGAGYWSALAVTVPHRNGSISTLFPARSFRTEQLHISGVFRVDQPEDGEVVFMHIERLRQLLQYQQGEVSYLSPRWLTYRGGSTIAPGEGYQLLDRECNTPRYLRCCGWRSGYLFCYSFCATAFAFQCGEYARNADYRKTPRCPHASLFWVQEIKMVDYIIILEGWLLSLTGLVIGLALGCGR